MFLLFFYGWFSAWFEGGTWLPRSPLKLYGGLWCFLLLYWFFKWGALSFFVMVSSGVAVRVLLNTTSWMVFYLGGVLWRFSSRRGNLSSISSKLCCRMMLYMLFSNSLAPCNLRLGCRIWNPGKASSCETRGGIGGPIEGSWTYPTT